LPAASGKKVLRGLNGLNGLNRKKGSSDGEERCNICPQSHRSLVLTPTQERKAMTVAVAVIVAVDPVVKKPQQRIGPSKSKS